MKKLILALITLVVCLVNTAYANQTRSDILMATHYLEDITNINLYPQLLLQYHNFIFADVNGILQDYGIILAPGQKYGALGCWQNINKNQGFYLGYALKLAHFELGLAGYQIADYWNLSFGLGRTYFARRVDLSLLIYDDPELTDYNFNLRLSRRKGDFVFIPRYTLHFVKGNTEYNNHNFGLMLKRLILNEGFVYLGAEYDLTRGDIKDDNINIYAGVELPVSRYVQFLCGVKETVFNDLDSLKWQIEPGLRLKIRDFHFDFHLNTERFFNDDVNLLKSIGFELDFSKF